MNEIGNYALPLVAGIIVFFGLARDIKVFDSFLEGGASGIKTAIELLPILIATVVAVQMLSASGVLDVLSFTFEPVASFLGLPKEVVPLILLHPVSGSGASALLLSILNEHGADSYIGQVAPVICASSETTFYAITVYFGSCGIKKIRYTLIAALIADFSAAIIAGIAVRLTL